MGILANLIIRIGADPTDLGKGLDKATRDVKRFGSELESAGARLTAGISLPLLGVGAAALQAAGKMEQSRVAFTTLLKSADAARDHLAELQKFALVTPFQFDDLTKMSRLMQAYGTSANDVVPKLRTIGNAVSALGGGNDVLERVVKSMGEIGTRGKITGEQLRELSRAGIPALQAIADKLGISVSEAQQRITAGMVDAQTATDALLGYMDKRFAGGMEAQSQTILGMWSNIKDKLTFTLVAIGDALIPWAKSFVSGTLDPMLDKIKSLAEWFGKLPKPIQDVALGTTGAAVAFPLLTVAMGATITNAIVIGGTLAKLITVLQGLAATIAGPLVAAAGIFTGSLAAMSTAAGAAASLGLAVLVVAIYELIQATNAWRASQAAAEEQEKQRASALAKLESTMRQQGINIDALRKQYDAGKLSVDGYVRALADLEHQHVKTAGVFKQQMDTQAALDSLNLKSTATRQKELETAKEAYEVLKKSGEGHEVLAEAALKVQQAEEALNGTIDKSKEHFRSASSAVKDYKDSLSEMLFQSQQAQNKAAVTGLVGTATEMNRFRTQALTLQQVIQKLKEQFDALGNAPAPNLASGLGPAELDKSRKVIDEIGESLGKISLHSVGESPFGQLAEGAKYFGITTTGEFEEIARVSGEKFELMLKSGKATQDDLARAALMTAQAEIDADLHAGRVSKQRHDEESRAIQKDLAEYSSAAKKKVSLQEQISVETRRMASQTFNALERGLASDIVHWKGFGATIKSTFQSLGEDILTIMLHALLKPVEKLFADLMVALAEKLLGVFITQEVASTAVNSAGVAQDAAVGGAAAAASIAAIPIIGPGLAIEAGLAMYGSILGTFLPLVLAGASAKGGFGELPHDMLVSAHAKEMILPADIAVPLRAQLRNGGVGSGGVSFPNCTFNGVTRDTIDMLGNMLIRKARFAGAKL
jgi:tape measure domain-containing protein